MALTAIQQVRLLVQDNDVTFPFLSDDEITFFLERNENNVDRCALECARVILLQLSLRGNETVDIFTISSSKGVSSYKDALLAFIKNPQLNPLYNGITPYAGGISLSDMETNNTTDDVNFVCTPLMPYTSVETFEV